MKKCSRLPGGRAVLVAFLSLFFFPGCSSVDPISNKPEFSSPELRLINDNLPPQEKTLIVMIHGWGGSLHDTWQKFPELLRKALPEKFDIASFNYPSGLSPASPPLQYLAKSLNQWIKRKSGHGNNADYRQYVFLTHSFGGLVVKQHLVSELSLGRNIKSDLVFLIGTPNIGDDVSKLAIYIPFIPKEQLRQLQDSAFLADLHEKYLIHTGLIRAEDVHPAVVKPIRTVSIFGHSERDSDGVVNVVSARAFFPDAKVVFKDHVGLVKPNDEKDDVFTIVRDEIEREIRTKSNTNEFAVAKQKRTPGAISLAQYLPALREESSAKKHIFFVHGWGSSPDVWANFIKLMNEDPRAQKVNLVAFKYPTGVDQANLATIASDLLKKFASLPAGDANLICHSLGAAICQEAILQALRAGRSKDLNINKMFLLAPPTSAWDLKAFRGISTVTTMFTWEMTKPFGKHLSFLAELQKEWFLRVKDGGDPMLPADFKKSVKVFAVFGSRDNIVSTGTSDLLFDGIKFVPGDHLSITQPKSRYDPVYGLVREEIFGE